MSRKKIDKAIETTIPVMIKSMEKISERFEELRDIFCDLPEDLTTRDECLKSMYNRCYTIMENEGDRCYWKRRRITECLEKLSSGNTGDITATVKILKEVRDYLTEMQVRLTWLSINFGITERTNRKRLIEAGKKAVEVADEIQELLSEVRDTFEELYLDAVISARKQK